MASSRLEAVWTPSWVQSLFRVMTMLARLGSGRPMDSKVFRPIRMGWPLVKALKRLRSSGRCQRRALPPPMRRFWSWATMRVSIRAE